MKAYIAVTDQTWFEFLQQCAPLDEINFWQPRAQHAFRALAAGELFLFKLHSPDDYIVGGGIFSYWTRLPVSLAWEAFGVKNGASNLAEMKLKIERYRSVKPNNHTDYEIGCILIQQPFFLEQNHWIPARDWKSNIVQGKSFNLASEEGQWIWNALSERFKGEPIGASVKNDLMVREERGRYGKPTTIVPRLGQGTFRVMVTDAYHRRCAITGEKVLPILEAAHIIPYEEGGEHRIDNGLLLRSDLHKLFDFGYLTITTNYRVEVSQRLKSQFHNGEEYFSWKGREIRLPENASYKPNREFLEWHNQRRFVA